MKKTFLAMFIAVLAILLNACSSDPFVGEWAPDNDTSGASVTELNSDGTVDFGGVTDDGVYIISGVWKRVEGSENTITIKYDASTAEADLDNPIAERLVLLTLQEMANETITLTLSDDGKRLYAEGGNGYFVKL